VVADRIGLVEMGDDDASCAPNMPGRSGHVILRRAQDNAKRAQDNHWFGGGGAAMEEPLFMAIRDSDPEFRQTVLDAQASLQEFRGLIRSPGAAESYPCVKTRLTAGKESAFIWLLVVRDTATGFIASVFEIPPEFKGIRVGDQVTVADAAVMDWMLNQSGTLRGGFSLRYQRSKLPPERRVWFDQHVGVSHYAEPGAAPDPAA
jgi:uncharacterized protein YegJ (DUF2314 family)